MTIITIIIPGGREPDHRGQGQHGAQHDLAVIFNIMTKVVIID